MGRDFLADRSSHRDPGMPIWAILDGLMNGTLKPSPYPHSWEWIIYGDENERVLYTVAHQSGNAGRTRRKR